MSFSIGILLALALAVFAHFARFDRDRSFYPTVLIVVASYYELFAAMGGSAPALVAESIVVIVFLVLSYLSFRYSTWLAVIGLGAHGVFDFFHGHVITNPGVPVWWPHFCMAFDVAAAGCLAGSLLRQKRSLVGDRP